MNDAENPAPAATGDKRAATLSKDGAWRPFPKVLHLPQYVRNGAYYARVKVNGKIIRRSLETDVWSTAKLRLVDFVKAQRTPTPAAVTMSFAEALKLYDTALESDSQYFNNTIATLRLILDCGIRELVRRGGAAIKNPAAELGRVRIRPKDLKLPERDQFRPTVENVRRKSGGWGRRTGGLTEFLAYGGMRVNSEARRVIWEDIDWQRREIIVRGKPATGTKNSEVQHSKMGLLNWLLQLLSRCADMITTPAV
jgi:integrase